MKATTFSIYVGAVWALGMAQPLLGAGTEASISIQAASEWEEVGPGKLHQELGKVHYVNARPSRVADYYIYLRGEAKDRKTLHLLPAYAEQKEKLEKKNVQLLYVGCDKKEKAVKETLVSVRSPFPGTRECCSNVKHLLSYRPCLGMPGAMMVTANGEIVAQDDAEKMLKNWQETIDKYEKGLRELEADPQTNGQCGMQGWVQQGTAGSCRQFSPQDRPSVEKPATVAEALRRMKIVNAQADTEAEYYIYYQQPSASACCLRDYTASAAMQYPAMRKDKVELIFIGAKNWAYQATERWLQSIHAPYPGVDGNEAMYYMLPGLSELSTSNPYAVLVDKKGNYIQAGQANTIFGLYQYMIDRAEKQALTHILKKEKVMNRATISLNAAYQLFLYVKSTKDVEALKKALADESEMHHHGIGIIIVTDTESAARSIGKSLSYSEPCIVLSDELRKIEGVGDFDKYDAGNMPVVALVDAENGHALIQGHADMLQDWEKVVNDYQAEKEREKKARQEEADATEQE